MKRNHQRGRRRLRLSKQTVKLLTDGQQDTAVGGRLLTMHATCPTDVTSADTGGC
jgi:hypothetical protein